MRKNPSNGLRRERLLQELCRSLVDPRRRLRPC